MNDIPLDKMIHQIDIFVGFTKIGSVIGSYEYINRIFPKWAMLRYDRKKEMGCSVQYRIK